MLNPPDQYATDRNLRSRQRLWDHLTPPFDLIGWVLELLDVPPAGIVLDVGCGNGRYLAPIRNRGAVVVGCDRSPGMLNGAPDVPVAVSDVVNLPFAAHSFDRLLTAHVLYHVDNRPAAIAELFRVLAGGGTCVAVTNGARHMESVWQLVERAVQQSDPGWRLEESHIRRTFSIENGAAQMRGAFDEVRIARPAHRGTAVVRDPQVVAEYVASVGDHYQRGLSSRWSDVVDAVRWEVAAVIERTGAFTTSNDVGAFICR